jgi:hydrogenase nickel incorporation protein HypA/HybF
MARLDIELAGKLVMHELSLARDLLKTVEKNLASADARVLRIDLRIGTAAGIVLSSLRFAFAVVAAGTRVEGAELSIVTAPARSRCANCGILYEFDGVIGRCHVCGTLGGELLSGNEMILRSIEVADV